jgi:hypothetical protein
VADIPSGLGLAPPQETSDSHSRVEISASGAQHEPKTFPTHESRAGLEGWRSNAKIQAGTSEITVELGYNVIKGT